MEGQSLGRAAGCRGETPAAVDSKARALCRSSGATSHCPKQASSSSLWLTRISNAPQLGSSCRTSMAACIDSYTLGTADKSDQNKRPRSASDQALTCICCYAASVSSPLCSRTGIVGGRTVVLPHFVHNGLDNREYTAQRSAAQRSTAQHSTAQHADLDELSFSQQLVCRGQAGRVHNVQVSLQVSTRQVARFPPHLCYLIPAQVVQAWSTCTCNTCCWYTPHGS